MKSNAIDAMVSAVREISDVLPVFFQRDSNFYAVSPQCYGRFSYHLSLVPQNPKGDQWRQELPEITDSEDVVVKRCSDTGIDANEKTKFKKDQRQYIAPLIFNRDSNGIFSLETMANTAKALAALPDDGKIRMISHSQSYHSHKHGYASDGTDTWLGDARVMSRERYFELMRAKEEEFFTKLSEIDQDDISRVYERSSVSTRRSTEIPDVTVITPNIMLTFPREGFLDYHNPLQTWTSETNLRKWPVYGSVRSLDSSPFGFYFVVNRKVVETKTLKGLDSAVTELMTSISDDLTGVKKAMPQIESFLERINNVHVHNKSNRKAIEYWKKVRADQKVEA